MPTVKEVLETIKSDSELIIFEEEKKGSSKYLDLLKNINFSATSILRVIDVEPNDKLSVWQQVTEDNNLKDVHISIFVINSISLITVISKEFLRYSGLSSSVKKALDAVNSCLENNKSLGVYSKVKEKENIYDQFLSYTFQEQRIEDLYSKSLDSIFEKELGQQEKRIDRINANIEYSKELLEAIESETGHASLVHGFKEYSKKLNDKKRKLLGETRSLKYLLLLVPSFSGLMSLMLGDLGFGFYASAVSAMAILGLLLRVNIRKEDQLDQVFTKIDNRIALSIFYRYQVTEGSEEDKKESASKFNSFIYSEIETSDWNAPDITEGIVKAIKEINK